MVRAAVATVLIISLWATTIEGQGLGNSPASVLGASSAQARLEDVYQQSRAWRNAYRNRPSATCSKGSGSLCSSSGLSTEQRAQLLMATSPQSYDSRSSSNTGGYNAVGQVKNQGDCNTCVSFVILAAAQSAMACALNRDATAHMSEQDFFFCKSVANQEARTCSSSWNMVDGVQSWATLDQTNNYPVMDYCMKYNPANPDCSSACKDTDPYLNNGYFKWYRLENAWEVMDHIRTWGSVVTRLNVYDDFKPFFARNPSGVYTGPVKPNFVESHAIQLVGYNLNSNPPYWIAKNSWGTGFASGGFFKIQMSGNAGVCNPDDTFGLIFVLNNPQGQPWNRLSGPTGKNCYAYRSGPGDYISKVARIFGLQINDVLADNAGKVKEPDMWLNGMQITLCGLVVPSGVKISGAAAHVAKPAALPPVKAAKPPAPGFKAVKYNPDQDQPYTGPLYNLQIGSYKGNYNCDGAKGSGTMYMKRDDAHNVGQVRVDSTFVQNGKCTYKMVLACNSVRDGSGTWCGGSEEPWDCDVQSISKWDACGGKTPARTKSLQMCYSNKQLRLKSEKSKCGSMSGTLKKG